MVNCPYCESQGVEERLCRLGLISADVCVVGALLQHTTCQKVFIVTKVNGPFYEMRLATEEEKARR